MIPLRCKILLSDMDGVLINSQPLHAKAESLVLEEFGKKVSPDEISRLFTGKGTFEMFSHYLGRNNAKIALGRKNILLQNELRENIAPIEKSAEFLHYIHGSIRIGVASGSGPNFITKALDSIGVWDLVECFASGEEVEKGKPDPAVFQLLMNRMNILSHECFILEDSPFGIIAAKSIKVFSVGLTTSYSANVLYEAGANIVCDSFADIMDHLVI